MPTLTYADIQALELPPARDGGAPYRLMFKDMDSGHLIVPDYQRGRVWSPKQAALFAGFVLTKGQPPPVWIQEHPDADTEEIIDGLQRLSAMRDFFDGKIPAELPDGRVCFRGDLAADCDGLFKSLHITKKIVRLPTRADVLRLYLRLNRGGTVHSDAEISRVQEMLRDEEQALSVASP